MIKYNVHFRLSQGEEAQESGARKGAGDTETARTKVGEVKR